MLHAVDDGERNFAFVEIPRRSSSVEHTFSALEIYV